MRLRYGCVITCDDYVKDENGNIIELKCSYHSDSFNGVQPTGLEKKVKGIIHWVNANDAKDVEVRLYDRLFKEANPAAFDNFLEVINEDSLKVINAKVEPYIESLKSGQTVQFERMGYFTADSKLSKDRPVFNRTVGLRDNWSKK